MAPSWRRLFLAGTLFSVLATTRVAATGVLDHLPDDAYGFLLLRDLASLDKDVAHLAAAARLVIPQPLAIIQAAAGVGAGLDRQGDALIAMLPGPSGLRDARPLVLLPVTDYAQFVGPLHGDPSGDICRITLLGEEVLIARDGDYALVMNLEHEPVMAQLMRIEPQQLASLDRLTEWIGANDAVICLLPQGIEAFTNWSRSLVANQQHQGAQRYAGQDNAEMLRQLLAKTMVLHTILDFFAAKTNTVAVGINVDAEANVVLSQRMLLELGETSSRTDRPKRPDQKPIADWDEQPIVAAATATFDGGDWNGLAKAFTAVMRRFPVVNGFEQLNGDDWQRIEDSNAALVAGLNSASLLVLPGKHDEPIFSNLFLSLTVDDVDAYFASYQRAFELWNVATEKSTDSSQTKYVLEAMQIDGRRALLAKADIGAATDDPNIPFMKNFMEIMFGKDAILRVVLVQRDDHALLVSIADVDPTRRCLAAFNEHHDRLYDAADIKTSLAMIDPHAPFRAVLSMQGALQWRRRYDEAILALGAGGPPKTPEVPASPPIALSLQWTNEELRTEMAWPAATLKAAATLAKLVWYGAR